MLVCIPSLWEAKTGGLWAPGWPVYIVRPHGKTKQINKKVTVWEACIRKSAWPGSGGLENCWFLVSCMTERWPIRSPNVPLQQPAHHERVSIHMQWWQSRCCRIHAIMLYLEFRCNQVSCGLAGRSSEVSPQHWFSVCVFLDPTVWMIRLSQPGLLMVSLAFMLLTH